MADHARDQHDHTEAAAHDAHNQATVRTYIRVFVALFVVTMIEVFITYIPMPQWALIAALIALSAVKGALVVMFFMHLRFDSRWFTFFFTAGIILATFGIITFLVLFGYRAGFVE